MPGVRPAELARIGAGTQKLERELAKQVPELELIRLDADAVEKPEQLRDALERFARADRAVLVGTQMVAKGHHFPASSSRRSSTPTRASACPTSARRSARSS